jgi:citrate lyase subunit beta/citryl-CoA lyase/(S)-citramalyl-CoA lyase
MHLDLLQTLLFVPANRPERYAKALASGADAIIIDLEDAVGVQDKAGARGLLAHWLGTQPAGRVLVRINGAHTPWFADDLAVCRAPAVAGIVVPKAESADELTRLAELCDKPLLPIIESATGLAAVASLAASRHVVRLLFGKLDLAVDLGLDYPPPPDEDPDETVFLHARSQLVLASRVAGLPPPVDGVFTALGDTPGLTRYVRNGLRAGFGGMLLIHPAQVAAVQAASRPDAAQLDWARRVNTASLQAAGAAISLDGAMVDAPVVLRARALLRRAGLA